MEKDSRSRLEDAAYEYTISSFLDQTGEQAFLAEDEFQDNQLIDEEQFKRYVLRELDAAGYFIQDCDSEVMKINDPNWKPYSSKTFGQMLMDFACQWNMEHEGRNYEYKLKL